MRSTYIHLDGLKAKNPLYPSRHCRKERLSREATHVMCSTKRTNSLSSNFDLTSNTHWHSDLTFLAETKFRSERLAQSCRLPDNMHVFNTHFLGYVGTVAIH